MEDRETEVIVVAPVAEPRPVHDELCLVILAGPSRGKVLPLDRGSLTLGRSSEASVVLDGRGLSRVHARLTLCPDGVEVQDLDSTNGLFVNGQRRTQAVLRPGDQLALGPEVSLQLQRTDPSLRQLLEELYSGSTRDSLTGLANRRQAELRLQEEAAMVRRHGLSVCLALLDLDHFKSVNDTYGHAAGDLVLQETADRLQSAIRQEDVLARYGGEEFLLILRHTALSGASLLMERLLRSISERPFELLDGQQLNLSLSAGLALFAQGDELEQVLQRADQALYKAKQSGRNQFCLG
ncbi:diguanylate cyclase [bacterium]|nr:diguanylate cyclase [bacterium]